MQPNECSDLNSDELIGREFFEILKNRRYNMNVLSMLAERKSMRDVEIEFDGQRWHGDSIRTRLLLSRKIRWTD
jgi:hypothetical protein